jgi:glycosyltransferase involved in cell wall biosynthesis
MIGAWMSRKFGVPLAASWHTNVHEYAARRSGWFTRLLPNSKSHAAERKIEAFSLAIIARFYKLAGVLYAPNRQLCELLNRATGRPCHLMPRGVDCELFHPAKRRRAPGDDQIVLGFVGRLSVEKNIFLLVQMQRELEGLGHRNFRFMIVGHGGDEHRLRVHLPQAEYTGVLRGEALSEAYASMDLFVFPSHTDTFGNVVLEALASGVPAVVTPDGGPASIVRDGETGRIAADADFSAAVSAILGDPALHEKMRSSARAYALTATWDSVFEGVYAGYGTMLDARGDLASHPRS